jgi:hypothetical protein
MERIVGFAKVFTPSGAGVLDEVRFVVPTVGV